MNTLRAIYDNKRGMTYDFETLATDVRKLRR